MARDRQTDRQRDRDRQTDKTRDRKNEMLNQREMKQGKKQTMFVKREQNTETERQIQRRKLKDK